MSAADYFRNLAPERPCERSQDEINAMLRWLFVKHPTTPEEMAWHRQRYPNIWPPEYPVQDPTPEQLALALILARAKRDPQVRALQKHRRKKRRLALRGRGV